MATSSVADFWRRRKLFIIAGVILLCAVVAFVHHRGRAIQKQQRAAQKELVSNSVKNVHNVLKGKMNPAKIVKHLPPVISQRRVKKPKLGNKNKVKDDAARKWKEDLLKEDHYGIDEIEEGDRVKGAVGDGRKGLWGALRPDGDMAGEAPLDQGGDNEGGDNGGAYPDSVLPDQKDSTPDKLGREGRKPPDKGRPRAGHQDIPVQQEPEKASKPDNRPKKLPKQRGKQPLQPGNLPGRPGNRPIQPGNLPLQPGNLPLQPGNRPIQPENLPVQPVSWPRQPENQLGNLPGGQPGNQPVNPPWNRFKQQPGNPPVQRRKPVKPIQPQDPVEPGNPAIQPPRDPVDPKNPAIQPPRNPVDPGNPAIQPPRNPVDPGNPAIQPPRNPAIKPPRDPVDPPRQPRHQPKDPAEPRNQPGEPQSDLYVHSSMPLGRPLSSTKTERQEAVVNAFKHAWKAYKKYAWGKDDVNPIGGSSSSSYFGMGMTLVDSLDTMWLMGLGEEFQEARDWVEQSLNIDDNSKTVSLFETNIRVLGGLLSAYHLSGDRMFLDNAVKLGKRLLPAFDTPSGIPSNTVSLSHGGHSGRSISTAEAGSLQLEFRDLSRASGDHTFQEKCDKTLDKMLSQTRGIVRQSLNCNSGQYSGSVYSAGAGIDSYYEYLIKQWIQSGRTENKFREAYESSTQDVLRYLVGFTQPSHMAYLGKRFSLSTKQPPSPVMDHLSCFYPGMLALGGIYQVLPKTRAVAENLTHTCYRMYEATTPTGIAPEIFQFNTNPQSTNDIVKSSDNQNLQRPETVESLFYMYRLTKDERYKEWGWKIFQAFEKYTKIEGGGYACLRNVHNPGQFRDRTESFFLTETLKYLYLLFGDDDSVLSLREWVFNTEAHPLPIWKMSAQ